MAGLMVRLGLDITAENFRIRAEQMRALLQAYPAMIAANVAMVPLVVWLMWGKVDHHVLLWWGGVLYLFHAGEVFHWLRYPRQIASIKECRRWQIQFLTSDLVVGALWGSAGVFMYVPGEPILQAFLLCILMGMAAGAVAGNLVFPLTQQLYVVLVMSPIVIYMMLLGVFEYYLLAGMVSVFLFFVMKTGRDQSRSMALSIHRQFENAELLESLKRASEQLKMAQKAAHAGMWEWDVAAGRMSWTDELFQLFGLDPQHDEASYERWAEILHPEDKEQAFLAVRVSIRNGTPLYNEYRILLPNGQLRWIVALGDSERNEQGETIRMTGLCFDNTEHKLEQHRAYQAESHYQTFIERSAIALLVHDLNGQLVEVNRQACEMLGYGRGELLRLNIVDISPNIILSEAKTQWERVESGVPLVFTTTQRRKDGRVFPVEVRLASVMLYQRKLIMVQANDISERMHIQNALLESEARYRNFAEQMPLGVTVLQDGRIKFINNAVTDMLGYSREELLDSPFPMLIHKDDRPWALDLHHRRMQGEEVPWTFVVRMVRKDGEVRRWELHTSNTDWEGGRGSLAIMADITERVAMEEALRDSVQKLEEKELAKTRFLAAAGHDLRQPVTAASLFVDVLKRGALSPEQGEMIAKLDQSMKIFSDLLERLLDISRFDAGQVKPQIVSCNLYELFGWLEHNFAEQASQRGLGFDMYLPQGAPLIVRADITLLQSVMMNLISNALKYTAKGGILVSARKRGDQVLLQVWDTGCGIDEEDVGKIFDEFYQVGNPQRNREAGLGLGLSICQRAMALLDSTIGCRSVPGRGSVFSFCLPLDQQQHVVEHIAEQAGLPKQLSEEDIFEGKKVVLLEDDSLVAEGMFYLLQGRGAEVLHFVNAETALQHEGVLGADIYIADHSLEGKLTGIDFLRTMQEKRGQPVRAVIVTGETASHFIETLPGLPWPVLHKPVNRTKLIEALLRGVPRVDL